MSDHNAAARAMLERTKEHYNKHSSTNFTSGKESEKKRRKGAAIQLKKFHNRIKKLLLERFATDAGRLLDLCCGRGGDLHKWHDIGVQFVHGIDLSPGEIAEATKRYQNKMKQLGHPRGFKCFFEQSDKLGIEPHQFGAPYDAVTCMFAAHYFFAAESIFKQFIQTVAASLKDGGHFLGTIPDGKRVVAALHDVFIEQHRRNKAEGKKTDLSEKVVMQSSVLRLEQRWKGQFQKYAAFGSPFIFALLDTVTDGQIGSEEFLVFFTPFKAVCAKYGLYPVTSYRYTDGRYDAECE